MKAKVLKWRARDDGGPTAEQMLNDWLANNQDKKIIQVSQSESGETTASYRITYTIWYEDAK